MSFFRRSPRVCVQREELHPNFPSFLLFLPTKACVAIFILRCRLESLEAIIQSPRLLAADLYSMLNKSFPCKQDVEDRGSGGRGFYLPNKVPLFCGSSSILSSEQAAASSSLCKSLVYIAKRKVKATIGTVPLSPMHEKREPGRRNGLLQSSSKSSSFKIEHQIEVVDAA